MSAASFSQAKVNFGSGGQAVRGWINVDKSPGLLLARSSSLRGVLARTGLLSRQQRAGFSKDVIYGDATRRLRFEDGEINYLYSSHMIEHLSRGQGLAFLREARRILRPGGTIRLATPDLAEWIEQYRTAPSGVLAADEFMVKLHAYHDTGEGAVKRFVSRYVSGHWHQWLYDEQSLRALLVEAGFVDLQRVGFRTGAFPDLDEVETRPNSLFLQGCSRDA